MRAPLLGALAAAGLALAACTSATGDTGGPGDDPAVVERAVVLAPDVHHADLVSGLAVGADGTALVWTIGPAGRAGVVVVDLPADGGARAGESVRLADVDPGLALTAGGEALLVGQVGSAHDGRYAVLALDPATGDVLDTRPIAGTEDAGQVEAAALPDGTIVVAGDRPGGLPFVLLVDPLQGSVVSAAAIDVSDVAGAEDRVQVRALTVSPDGSMLAVALAVQAEGGSSWTPAVAVLEIDPFSPGDVVALDADGVRALAVADDGTAYVAPVGSDGVLAVSAGGLREVPAELGEVTGLAVVAGELVVVDRGLRATRLDPVAGTATAVGDLCADTGAASGIDVAPDGSLVVVANCSGAGLWVLPG